MNKTARWILLILALALTVVGQAACSSYSTSNLGTPPGDNTSGTPTPGTPGGNGHPTGHKPNKNAPKAPVTAGTPPAAIDLTQYDPPVGNQSQLGSCTAWATGYYLRGWYAERDGYYPPGGSPPIGGFAPMYLYAQIVKGNDVGSSFADNLNILAQQGIDTRADYSQGDYDYTTQPTASEVANAAHYKITSYTNLGNPGGTGFQNWAENTLASGNPIALSFPVYPEFDYVSAETNWLVNTPTPQEIKNGPRGYHAVFAPRYDANGLWIENSWGAGWGNNGYAELSWAFVNNYGLDSATMFPAPRSTTPTFAVVNSDGSLVRGSNVSATTRLGPGRYEVTITQDVSLCAYTATIGDPANALVYAPGLVYTAGGHANGGGADPRGVYVETKNLGGGLGDWPFHLSVSCGAPYAVVNFEYAVVNSDGSLVRGSNFSKTTRLGTGRYEVTFSQNVDQCAYTATIGDPANALVYAPGLVYTAGGHASGGGADPQGVYVETKNLGGGLGDWPFHLSVNCVAPYAVVNSDGSLVRGNTVSATTRLGPGRYEVTFTRDVSQCAYTATIGDPANALVYAPGLVYTAGGHANGGGADPRGVYVETTNLGGGLGDWPFHLSVSC